MICKKPKRWLEFLHKQIGEEQTNVLQLAFGAILFNYMYKLQQALFFIGPGASGKSCALEVLQGLINPDYVASVSPFRFWSDNSLYQLTNKIINVVPELEKNAVIPSAIFKSIVVGDRVSVKKLYNDVSSTRITCSHLFCSNHLINSEDGSSAFYRRFLIIKFFNTIPIAERVLDYSSYLLTKEKDEIFSWAVRGMCKLMKENIKHLETTEHNEVLQELQDYNNSFVSFFKDTDYIKILDKPSIRNSITRKSLFELYLLYCKEVGLQPQSKYEFIRFIDKRFGDRKFENPDGVIMLKGFKVVII